MWIPNTGTRAKYAFNYSKAGVALSYTPWLRKLVNDVALAYLAGYYKLGDSDMQAIGASLRYFSLGEVQESRDGGMGNQLILNPYEMAFDVSYSRKLSDVFSMAVALQLYSFGHGCLVGRGYGSG